MLSLWIRMALLPVLVLALTAFPVSVQAAHLPAPGNVACSTDGTNITASWDAVAGATHYGVEFTATFADGSVTETDLSVRGEATTSLSILLSDLAIDTDADGVADTNPDSVDVSLKALHPGKGEGRQNSAKSAPVSCGVTPAS